MNPGDFAGMGLGITAVTFLCIAGSFALTIPLTIGIIIWVRKAFMPDTTTLKEGLAAQAKILQVAQTGTMVNYQPQVALTLEVTPSDGQPAYQTVTKMVLPMVNIPMFQPGATFPAKINPKDRNKVVLDVYAMT
jgi:hypothetical protein